MKTLILLQAVSSTQAHRNCLRIYAKIELLERGKLITQRTYFLGSGSKEKPEAITCSYISESSGIVPWKLAKASGGIATSQCLLKLNYTKIIRFD